MSSVNGQIMPPVMGAAAFLMVEYVGIPVQRDRQARGAAGRRCRTSGLLYIVHLEALKLGMQPIITCARRGRCRRRHAALRPGPVGQRRSCGALLYYLLSGG